jgi:hypothetical protein
MNQKHRTKRIKRHKNFINISNVANEQQHQQNHQLENLTHDEIIDFMSRINRLRFIDDSASQTSTAVTSPVENKINPFLLLNQHQDLKYRNYKYLKSLKKHSKINITSSSSTETLCSNDDETPNQQTNTSDYDNTVSTHRPYSRVPSNTFKPSNIKAAIAAVSQTRNRHRYKDQSGTSTVTDTDSATDQDIHKRQNRRVFRQALIKMRNNIEKESGKSGLDEKYFVRQVSDISSCEATSEVNFDEHDTIIEEDEDEDDDDDDDDDNFFASILVEDGFIRMSSPAGTDDENSMSNEFNCCEYCKFNSKTKSSNCNGAITINNLKRFSSCTCYLKNFPNVGSSPVTEESEFFLDCVDLENKKISEDSDEQEKVGDESEDDVFKGEDDCEDEDEDDDNEIDEIIVHNTLENSKVEISSFKIENPIVVVSLESLEKKPQPIIKKSSLVAAKSTQQNTLNNDNNAQGSANSSALGLLTFSVNSNSTVVTNHSVKPKVRFNLDVNYEKEREWNRINKILGDASKTQIEWTDEVEV